MAGLVVILTMADNHSAEVRSYNMSRIRSKDTKPELIVRQYLHAHGFRFRLHVSELPRKPDIVLPKYKTVIFVNGCFWHGHAGCPLFRIPSTRVDYWLPKINNNKKKDAEAYEQLKRDGWHVVIIHECEIRPANRQKTLTHLLSYLKAPAAED